MAQASAVGLGVYDLNEAAHLLGVPARTLTSWGHPTGRGIPALLEPSLSWAYSFHDLVSLAVIAVFQQRGVKRAGVYRAIQYLRDHYQEERPLARKGIVEALATAGDRIMWNDVVDVTHSGQMALLDTIQKYLVPVKYGSNFLAKLWRPAPSVTLDPEVQAGKPCIQKTRVTTDVVAERVAQGESPSSVASDLHITSRDITRAVAFEAQLDSGRGLALITA